MKSKKKRINILHEIDYETSLPAASELSATKKQGASEGEEHKVLDPPGHGEYYLDMSKLAREHFI